MIDHPDVAAWQPWSWEWSSALLLAVIARERRFPFRFDTWRGSLPRHLVFSVPFSLIHVLGMIGLRKIAHGMAGGDYNVGPFWLQFGYEYLKDVRSHFSIIAALGMYRLWRLRLLEAPDESSLVEPVERPERFLVRKLGKEFLLNAREIEWLQACGDYVNLHLRGRDYPLHATMSGIAGRRGPARFVRVRRGYFVNLDHLEQIEPLETGNARLRMRDGSRIPCSRSYRSALRERCGSGV
jgi:uncharacterized protein YlzI (FlbEa/FlbD family)